MRLITQTDEGGYDLEEYLNYLEQIRESLPKDARSFALASWHYDMDDTRCPHDSWVESVILQEISQGSRNEIRRLEIVATFLGAFHDGYFEIAYKDVQSYSLAFQAHSRQKIGVAHGDWMVDEILLVENGLVSHEIAFSEPGSWK